MKTKHLFLMIVAGLLAASCNGDDAPDYASRIARTYTGAIELSVSGVPVSSYTGMGKTLEISRVNNDSIVAVLTIDYGTGAMAVEKVTAGAKVTYKDGDKAMGVLGIIGPKRMEYEKMMSLVNAASKMLKEYFKKR